MTPESSGTDHGAHTRQGLPRKRCLKQELKISAGSSFAFSQNFVRKLRLNTFIKVVIAHHHRRSAATGQAFDKFDRKFPVRRRLQAVLLRVEAELLAEVFVQPARTAQRATK